MLQAEFKNLTGLDITPEEYQEVENVYMSSDYSKEYFCNMWKNASEEARCWMIDMSRMIIRNQAHMMKMAKQQREIEDAMFESVQKFSDPDLRKVCIESMGKKNYIKKMINEERNLWEADRQMIVEMISDISD